MKRLFFLIISLTTTIFTLSSVSKAQQGDWTMQNSGSNQDLKTVKFVNETTGWAAGVEGTILHTNDGGNTWTEQNSGTNLSIVDMSFFDENTGWILTDFLSMNQVLIKTTDGGSTWQEKEINIKEMPSSIPIAPMNAVFFLNEYVGWLCGLGWILVTYDGGETWEQLITDGDPGGLFEDVFFINSTTGWATATSSDGPPIVIHTNDGGNTWEQQNTDFLDSYNYDLYSIRFLDKSTGWATGHYSGFDTIEYTTFAEGIIIHTTDGGETWEKQSSRTTNIVSDLHIINENIIWARCGGARICFTPNAGVTWAPVPVKENEDLKDISFVNKAAGWAVGTGGTILRYEATQPGTSHTGDCF